MRTGYAGRNSAKRSWFSRPCRVRMDGAPQDPERSATVACLKPEQ
jgi:hypothetical protein